MKEAKRQLVLSWLTKAQHDLAAAEVLSQSVLSLLDTAIYHCQQAAEKSLKGYLVFCDQEFEQVVPKSWIHFQGEFDHNAFR